MDQELVVRAKGGDPSAFRTLAIESHPRLFDAAYGILRDRDLAQDATQQALVNIWRHIGGLRDTNRFEGWSYRILIHACYGEARERPQWQTDAQLLPGQEPCVSGEFGRVDDRDQLERAFRRLSLEHRSVVVLHHLAGLTLGDVGEALDLSVGTVKSRLHRAMAELRASLEADARVPTTAFLGREVPR
jgi:RNA polymerase sigma-70 factor (ECF subfamily)